MTAPLKTRPAEGEPAHTHSADESLPKTSPTRPNPDLARPRPSGVTVSANAPASFRAAAPPPACRRDRHARSSRDMSLSTSRHASCVAAGIVPQRTVATPVAAVAIADSVSDRTGTTARRPVREPLATASSCRRMAFCAAVHRHRRIIITSHQCQAANSPLLPMSLRHAVSSSVAWLCTRATACCLLAASLSFSATASARSRAFATSLAASTRFGPKLRTFAHEPCTSSQ